MHVHIIIVSLLLFYKPLFLISYLVCPGPCAQSSTQAHWEGDGHLRAQDTAPHAASGCKTHHVNIVSRTGEPQQCYQYVHSKGCPPEHVFHQPWAFGRPGTCLYSGFTSHSLYNADYVSMSVISKEPKYKLHVAKCMLKQNDKCK